MTTTDTPPTTTGETTGEPEAPPPNPLLRQLIIAGWRHRRRLAPAYAAAAVFTVGTVLALPGDGWRTALVTATTVTVWMWWRLRRRARRWGPWRRRWAWTCHTVACAWVVAAASHGPRPPLPGLLLLATIALGVPWWWWHRIRPMPGVDEAVARWDTRLAAPGKRLPGSAISTPEPVVYAPPGPRCDECDGTGQVDDGYPCQTCAGRGNRPGREVEVGFEAVGQLPPGELTTADAVAAVPHIASAFHVPLQSVFVESTPGGEADQFVVRVYHRNPLRDRHVWPGPALLDEARGVAPVGVYADMQPMLWRFWQPGSGPWHGLVSGTTGAGKSTLVKILLAYLKACPHTATIVIDPVRGGSLTEWRDQVSHYAKSIDEGVDLLARVEAYMYQRGEQLANLEWVDDGGRARCGVDFFDPAFGPITATNLPLVFLVVEEAHLLLADPEALRIVEVIAKVGRKWGFGLILITQMPLASELGGSSVLKEMVSSGNVVVLRTGTRLAGDTAFAGTLPVDPHELPREWPDGTSTAGLCFAAGALSRPAPARVYDPGDIFGWSRVGTVTRIPLPAPAPDPGPAAAAPTPAAGGSDTAAGTAREGAAARVLDVLRKAGPGGARTGVIAQAAGVSLNTASMALRRLADAGKVTNPQRGLWIYKGD